MTELLKMDASELRRDIRELRNTLFHSHLGLEMSKEKNSGLFRTNRRQLARMLTALSKLSTALPKKASSSKIPAR